MCDAVGKKATTLGSDIWQLLLRPTLPVFSLGIRKAQVKKCLKQCNSQLKKVPKVMLAAGGRFCGVRDK